MTRYRTMIVLAGLVASAPAGAVSWGSFNAIGLTSGSIYCSTTTCQTTTTGLSGSIITLTAYSTPTLSGTSTSTPDGGTWLDARIRNYSGSGGGISISNNVQANSTETSSPQHAIENRGVNDILVVDFGSDYWDVSAFTLGYRCRLNSAGDGCASSGGYSSTSVDVDAWVGGSGVIDFNTISFVGGLPTGGGAMFTELTLSPDATSNATLRTNVMAPEDRPLGRYLIITGNLDGAKDAFKVTGFTAEHAPPPPGENSVPVPGSMPLLVAGLLGLWASRRRLASSR